GEVLDETEPVRERGGGGAEGSLQRLCPRERPEDCLQLGLPRFRGRKEALRIPSVLLRYGLPCGRDFCHWVSRRRVSCARRRGQGESRRWKRESSSIASL